MTNIFRFVVLSLCLIFSAIKMIYSAPSALLSQTSSLSPKTLQAADGSEGQWSNVSNLISGSGFSQHDENTQIQSTKNNSKQKASFSKNSQSGNTTVAFVSEAQFLQLQQLVIQINKNVTQLQQQLNTNIAALKQENYTLAERVQNLEMVARLLNVELHSLKKTQTSDNVKQVQQNKATTFLEAKYQQMYNFVVNQSGFFWITLFALLFLILLLIGLFTHRRSKNTLSPPEKDNDASPHQKEEGEYDFMNTKDAIPAKFDLANAYIQMGNTKEAEHVLADILKIGTDEEKKKAQELLQKIQEKG